jgi:murein DD-endopeptidase MepM/ murein hydrolase activator NlpD
MSEMIPLGGGEWFAVIPISNTREPGEYSVAVSAGATRFDNKITVLPFAFDHQNLRINTANPAIAEASSPQAVQEFREKVYPIYQMFEETRYWSGVFRQPVKGRISTNFGEIRITNGDPSTERSHNGMDIAAPQGTPILSPNAGRVVFAEYLLNTGNTILIEHGGGLKSVFFHMFSLDVAAGDKVETGTKIGTVGTTGYSTGPHLHFEIRIGEQAVSPQMLFQSDAGLYTALNNLPPIRVYVNQRELPLDAPAYVQDGRTLVPMRAIFEALGASVQWDEATETVEAHRGVTTVRLTVGSNTARCITDSVSSEVVLDTAPAIAEDRVFVPLRFAAEILGANVAWEEETRTVMLNH